MKLHGASQQGPQHPLQGRPAQHRLQLPLVQGETANSDLIYIKCTVDMIRKQTKRRIILLYLGPQLTLVLKCRGVEGTVNPSLPYLHHHHPPPGWSVEGQCEA